MNLLKIAVITHFFCSLSAASLNIQVVSSRSAFIFTEQETIDISVRVFGVHGIVNIDYFLQKTGGDWIFNNTVIIKTKCLNDTITTPIHFSKLERGHYKLKMVAYYDDDTVITNSAIAIVFPPSNIRNSLWGLMFVPMPIPMQDSKRTEDELTNFIKNVGASWVRYNFWEHMYDIRINSDDHIVLDLTYVKKHLRSLTYSGVTVLGHLIQVPKILSSKPEAVDSFGDAGPLYGRVRPINDSLWMKFVKQLAFELKNEIKIWEIWNEPEHLNSYWTDSVDAFIQLVKNTSLAIKEGNPDARIATAGFISSSINTHYDIINSMFTGGIGNHFDILSLHYTDENSSTIKQWLALLNENSLNKQIIITEEKSIIPLENLKNGFPSAKFSHSASQYLSYIPLINKDWTINPSAVTYSVGAHLIGNLPYLYSQEFKNFIVYYFCDKTDTVAIVKRRITTTNHAKLFNPLNSITITFDQLSTTTNVYDQLGRNIQQTPSTNSFIVPFEIGTIEERLRFSFSEPCVFIKGRSNISTIVEAYNNSTDLPTVVEAENGLFSNDWEVTRNSQYSSGEYLALWKEGEFGNKSYTVNLYFNVSKDGLYQIYYSGNSLARLKSPTSISPFTWNIDNHKSHTINGDIIVLYGLEGSPDGLSLLGEIYLNAGQHSFNINVISPRQTDSHYALWFDAIVLHKVK